MAAKQQRASPSQAGRQLDTKPPPPPQALSTEGLKDIIRQVIKEQAKENLTEIKTVMKTLITEEVGSKIEDAKVEIAEIKDSVETQIDALREDIVFAVKGLVVKVNDMDEKMIQITERVDNLDKKVADVQQEAQKADDELVLMQYRSMEFALRVRGIKEDRSENLTEILADVFGDMIAVKSEYVVPQIDKIYRVNSWIARQRQLPRDVVVYFTTRTLRNDILQASYRHKVQIGGKDIIILKELPSKILKGRKEFGFLAEELKKRQMQFRWDIPTGIIVTVAGIRYRLNTIWKAKDFCLNVLKVNGQKPAPTKEREDQKGEEANRQQKPIEQAQGREEILIAGGEELFFYYGGSTDGRPTKKGITNQQRGGT